MLTAADNSAMSVQALLPVELHRKTLPNKAARVTYLKQSFGGKVVAIDRQVSLGANNHPAMYRQIRFSTGGSLPAGFPANINTDNNWRRLDLDQRKV